MVEIKPNSIWSADELREALGLKEHSLRREIRLKRLRARKRCGRHFLLGSDILAWMARGVAEEPKAAKAGAAG